MPRGVGASTYKHIMVATCLGWFVFLLRRLNPPKYREPGAQYTGNTRRKKRDVPGIKFRLPIYSCALGECTHVGWHQFRHDVQSSARHTRQGNQVKTISIGAGEQARRQLRDTATNRRAPRWRVRRVRRVGRWAGKRRRRRFDGGGGRAIG